MPEPLAILVVGDDPLVRRALRAALSAEADLDVQDAETADWEAAAVRGSAELVVWDTGPDGSSLPPGTDLPTVAVVADAEVARVALGGGAASVVFRDGDGVRLAAALRGVQEGFTVIDRAFDDALVPAQQPPPEWIEPLTPREREVLDLLAEGLSNREIAAALGVSDHTAKFHVQAILAKLDAAGRTEAVVTAIRLGLLTV